eukprot:377886-Rhodomonas_salina.3
MKGWGCVVGDEKACLQTEVRARASVPDTYTAVPHTHTPQYHTRASVHPSVPLTARSTTHTLQYHTHRPQQSARRRYGRSIPDALARLEQHIPLVSTTHTHTHTHTHTCPSTPRAAYPHSQYHATSYADSGFRMLIAAIA